MNEVVFNLIVPPFKTRGDKPLELSRVIQVKMGGRIVRHARHILFQLAEVAVPRDLFAHILERVNRLRLAPV